MIALLTEQKDALADLTEDYFYQIPVGPPDVGGISPGYFWIVRPEYGDVDLPIYGLTDEAAKLNINSATADSLRTAVEGLEGPVAAICHQPDCSGIMLSVTGDDPGFQVGESFSLELDV